MRTKLIFLIALSTAVSVQAVPLPGNAPEDPPAPPAELAEPEAQAPELGDPKPKGIGFLGVSAQPIPAFQAEQLKLDRGVSLTTVMAGSPAAKAGLEVGDIVAQVGDQKVATMLDLSDAIQAHKEGDKVTLKVIQQGKEVEKEVTLAARPAPPEGLMQGGFGAQVFPGAGIGGGLRFNFGGPGGGLRIGDAEGSVELKGRGEGREVVVRDHDEEIVFEGPWVTPQDKAAAPPHFKQRIDRMAGIFGEDDFGALDLVVPQVAPLMPDDEEFKPLFPQRKRPDPVAPKEVAPEEDDDR